MVRIASYSWGVVPSDDELAAFIQELSAQHYSRCYLPSMHLFNEKRPSEWRQALAVLRAHALPGTGEGWQQLLAQLGFGAPVAPRGVAAQRAMRIHRRQSKLDDPLVTGPSLAEYNLMERSEGLPVVPRTRAVRAWCPQRHCYVTIGEQLVWEIR